MKNDIKDKPKMFKGRSKIPPKIIISYPSDRAGCGFYRTIVPFSYLIAEKDYNCPFLYSYNFDLNFIGMSNWLRFQRMATESHKALILKYKSIIKSSNSKCKICYELDDLIHEVEATNIMAYQYYTPSKKKESIEIMKACDLVTFSTEFLKNYYEDKFDIKHSTVIPNFLPKYMWGNCGKRTDKVKTTNKLRILWSGSSSHIAKNGDFEFLIPLIEKTLDEFEWIFLGVCPPQLYGKVEFYDWSNFYQFPQLLDSINADVFIAPIKDCLFNYGKSDLKLLEATAIGLPCICSTSTGGLGPYDLVPDSFCIENKVDTWYDALKEFHNDESLWEKTLKAGQKELEQRWLEDNINLYVETYK